MKKMTEESVKGALAGESQAHIKYLAFAEKAAADKKPNLARLFRAAADSERIHATNHLKVLDGVGESAANVKAALGGETFEVEEMYPAYLAVAREQGEKKAEMFFHAAMEAEKVHAGLYGKALAAVEKGGDVELKPVHVCQVCGYTMEGDAPDKCPICGAPKSKFVTF